MLLERTEGQVRGAILVESKALSVSVHDNVYYLPHVENGMWGIFDEHDKPVEAAVERGFSDLAPLRQIPQSNIEGCSVADQLSDDFEYIYGGRFVPHFGHFIIETLARFWPYLSGFSPQQRIVMHGDGSPHSWFSFPYARTVFEALGITRDIIVHSDLPVRIPRLLVSEPSFRPQASGCKEFATFCRALGKKIEPCIDAVQQVQRAVYLSKTRLDSGVALWHNEHIVESYLSRNGVKIIHPQHLSLKQHIGLFASRPHICGVVGSAHHVCMFSGEGARMTFLSPERPNSNFYIIDRLNRNESIYLYPSGTQNVAPRTSRFIVEREIHNPVEVAKALLERL